MATPDKITRQQLSDALAPLCELLGVPFGDTYTPLVIGSDAIVFAHAVSWPQGVQPPNSTGNTGSVLTAYTHVMVVD